MIVILARAVAAAIFGALVLAGYRSIQRRSRILGVIVACAILLRTAAGLAMFWISYLKLPIAQTLQAGGGFWQRAGSWMRRLCPLR